MNLAAMTPRGDLASTKYCLANPGHEYLIYLPDGGEVTVDLSAVKGRLEVEWFNPRTSGKQIGAPIDGGAMRTMLAPFNGNAVLNLSKGEP
ncbi:MAG: putative collagen-binding domain-containing protein [Pirellulaceae bacterium]